MHNRSALNLTAVLSCLGGLLSGGPAGSAEPVVLPRTTDQAVVLENEVCRYEIGTDGKNRALICLADQQDYAQPGVAFMLVGQGQQSFAAAKVELAGDVLTVSFTDCPLQVKAKVEIRPRYFTLTVVGVSGGELDWLQL